MLDKVNKTSFSNTKSVKHLTLSFSIKIRENLLGIFSRVCCNSIHVVSKNYAIGMKFNELGLWLTKRRSTSAFTKITEKHFYFQFVTFHTFDKLV